MITNVGYNIPNVTGLVYVVGFALIRDNLLAYFVDVSKLPNDLLIIDSGGFAYINPAMFAGALAQDVNSIEADCCDRKRFAGIRYGIRDIKIEKQGR